MGSDDGTTSKSPPYDTNLLCFTISSHKLSLHTSSPWLLPARTHRPSVVLNRSYPRENFAKVSREDVRMLTGSDYTSNPPSLCFRNSTVCGQGNVPVLGVNATTTGHIQAGVRFASTHNLKVAVKASGHDYLGRSTAKNSFLLWTRNFQNITFHDSFAVGGKNMGPAVTAGSGVGLHTLYQPAKVQGKIYVGGTAATVVAAGGYVQGAGHSALAPTFGLAADNTLEFQIVIANGSLVTANEVSNSDLVFALRGGGAGSWGVIISATFRVFPTFNAVHRNDTIIVNTSAQVAQLAELHARHIFDMDSLNPAQYFYWTATAPTFKWFIYTIFPNTTIAAANAAIAPFLDGVRDLGFTVQASVNTSIVNDVLSNTTDDIGGIESILGSRLWSSGVYRNNVSGIGAYKTLFDSGVTRILGNMVAGGQVSRNANISNAVNPKWRTAKTHWLDTTTPVEVAVLRSAMTQRQVPVLAAIAPWQRRLLQRSGRERTRFSDDILWPKLCASEWYQECL
ncbi:FAD-binding domain-containing protein [Ramaria rubella]|nr:FAD-binding domain-containing protein [Ramaria rubella]